MKLKIRDGHAVLNGDKTEYSMPSGTMDIIAEDGRTLFGLTLGKDGTLRIDAGTTCKVDSGILDDRFTIKPVSSNVIELTKPLYR